jgi:hypothetical protein
MALWAHNLKVAGSNPAPATIFKPLQAWLAGAYCFSLPRRQAPAIPRNPRHSWDRLPNFCQIFGPRGRPEGRWFKVGVGGSATPGPPSPRSVLGALWRAGAHFQTSAKYLAAGERASNSGVSTLVVSHMNLPKRRIAHSTATNLPILPGWGHA